MSDRDTCDCGRRFEELSRQGDGHFYYCDKCDAYYNTERFPALVLIENRYKDLENARLTKEAEDEQRRQDDIKAARKIAQFNERIRIQERKRVVYEARLRELREEHRKILQNLGHFFYLCPITNLSSILHKGILPKNTLTRDGITYYDYSNKEVQSQRDRRVITLSNGTVCGVHDLVPLYFTYDTPTAYKMIHDHPLVDFVFLCINPTICLVDSIGFAFSDGNVASPSSHTFTDLEYLKSLNWQIIRNTIDPIIYLTDLSTKRQKCSEMLISPKVDARFIVKLIVRKSTVKDTVMRVLARIGTYPEIEVNHTYY